jgi:hypothetical protein
VSGIWAAGSLIYSTFLFFLVFFWEVMVLAPYCHSKF